MLSIGGNKCVRIHDSDILQLIAKQNIKLFIRLVLLSHQRDAAT